MPPTIGAASLLMTSEPVPVPSSIGSRPAMVAAAVICGFIYIFVERRSLNTTFGDARHGLWAALVRTALRHLHRVEYHDQNWRPNLLIFGGPATRRRYLLDLGASVIQDRGIVSYIHMLEGEVAPLATERRKSAERLDRLAEDYPTVFFRADIVPEVYRGVTTVTQSYGIGSLEANTVMLGASASTRPSGRCCSTRRDSRSASALPGGSRSTRGSCRSRLFAFTSRL